jgi:hypothetical protein
MTTRPEALTLQSARRGEKPRPPCEVCGEEPASSFSFFEAESTWRFAGDCTALTEDYYVPLAQILESENGWTWKAWIEHLGRKPWFSPKDFSGMLDRYKAAGGALPGVTPIDVKAVLAWTAGERCRRAAKRVEAYVPSERERLGDPHAVVAVPLAFYLGRDGAAAQ